MKLNPAAATEAINKSTDKAWMEEFRTRMIAAEKLDMVTALDRRLAELNELAFRTAIGSPTAGLSLIERVRESVRIHQEFLTRKRLGKGFRAARINAMIKRWGEKEALSRTVMSLNASTGLELLAKYSRLDCAYEQIILDFPHEFHEGLVTKARANLARLSHQP
jgi:hypothetical protein